MCGAVFSLLAVFCLIAVFVGKMIITVGAAVAVFFLIALGKYKQARNRSATPMVCPNCQSHNVKIQSRVTGISGATTTVSSFGIVGGNVHHGHVGVCQECGFDFPFFVQDEIVQMQNSAQGLLFISLIFVALYIGFLVYFM